MNDPAIIAFVDDLPEQRKRNWEEIRDELASHPGHWAAINAPGGYPRQRLKELGCEICVVDKQTYARWNQL